MSATLEYASPARVVDVDWREGPQGVSIRFPPPNRALALVGIISAFFTAGAWTWLYSAEWTWYQRVSAGVGPSPIQGIQLDLLIGNTVATAMWWIAGLYQLIAYRRWRRLPEFLEARDGSLIDVRRGVFGMRRRVFPANEIREIAVKPIRNLLGRKFITFLVFRFHHRRSLRRRISSRNPMLPDEIAAAFRRELGVEAR